MTNHQKSSSHVRAQAFYAGIAAALMLYFSYSSAGWTGDPTWATHTIDLALLWGGWALAGTTVLLLIGFVWALAIDAVVTGLAAAGFLAGGLGLTVAFGGMTGFLYIIFGLMFASAARHGWQMFRYLTASGIPAGTGVEAGQFDPGDVHADGDAPSSPWTEELAPGRAEKAVFDAPSPPPPTTNRPEPEPEPEPPSEPPPDGYLAQFAKPSQPPPDQQG